MKERIRQFFRILFLMFAVSREEKRDPRITREEIESIRLERVRLRLFNLMYER